MHNMKPNSLYYLLVVGIVVLAGCMVGQKYAQPEAPVNITYRETPATDTTALMKWFELYQDTALQTMIKTSLDSNRDLLGAAARVEEARLQTAFIKANLYPKFDYAAQVGGGQAGNDAQKAAAGIDGVIYNAMGVLSWELDIWGKLRRSNKAALANYLSVAENRNALRFSLVAEVASQYFLLRDLDNRLAIARQTLLSRKESTRIITERFNKGYVSEIDLLLAKQQEAIAASAIPALERQVVQTENALRLLMGMGPGTVSRGYTNFDQILTPDIPIGLSSQLLERRPDIRASEKALQSQFEKIGVAQANRFPTLSLTGLLGFASPQLSTFISSSGFMANGFAGITGPIFNFRQNKNIVEIEKQRTEQAIRAYQQTVLGAFGEVDNALNNYRTYAQEYEQRTMLVNAASKSLELFRARYDNGYSSYLEVTLQETNLFDAQLLQSIALQGKLTAIVQLYRSLGGGWD